MTGRWPPGAAVAALVLALTALVAAQAPDLVVTPIARDGEVLVSFALNEGLTPDVRDAIHSGLSTSIVYDLELRRASAAWFDRTIAEATISATVRFDNLTRRYQCARALNGRIEDARPTEDEGAVQRWMTRFDRVPLAATTVLEPNADYYVRVRARTRPRSGWFAWPWEHGAASGNARFTFIP
jgi:hypothetical protein